MVNAVMPMRKKMAEKMGFDAYAVTSEMPDPTAHAISAMLDHLHEVDSRFDTFVPGVKKTMVLSARCGHCQS